MMKKAYVMVSQWSFSSLASASDVMVGDESAFVKI